MRKLKKHKRKGRIYWMNERGYTEVATCKEMKMEMEALGKEWAEYEANAKVGEVEWVFGSQKIFSIWKMISKTRVVEAFKILTSDDKVKAILVNIFGGIMKCDVIASGIVNAAKQVALKVPVVVRLERTNVDQGKRILKVVEAFKILTSDDKVKAILVNIFGGIMKCDVIASGIVNAAKQVALKVPVVVSLERTNVDQGKRILKESGMTLITAEDLDDVAKKAVKAASK
ncbi:hypothetical protein PVK06_036260 [Gossypium arboreum]|uniref:ATP-citrate synthase/succinyl-CoA ligase C-terminal domain-containing protein n=3 Tax=Gossypium arboreum TaxID=29729 RepID=A0ABR0NK82_GOSAR|nr:hypothetical protein PVK06_036260 [Gossypium arboreum]